MEQIYGVWAVRSAASMFGHAEAWCKEDGRPLEFESLEAAQAYALELNRKATVNVRYFVKEKEPEPNAVRVPASQPDIEAVGPVDHVPRNEVAEKHNEIPGRQMAPEADPVVEIRSAVSSFLLSGTGWPVTFCFSKSFENRKSSPAGLLSVWQYQFFQGTLLLKSQLFQGTFSDKPSSVLRLQTAKLLKIVFSCGLLWFQSLVLMSQIPLFSGCL